MAAARVALPPGTSLHACRGCGGTWADTAASQRIATSAAPELEAVDEILIANPSGAALLSRSAPRVCPVCRDLLERVVVAQTELDACPRHGTFFDRAELGRVIRILERQRNLADPSWSSGEDMRWVSGNTGLTRPILTSEELKERQSRKNAEDLRQTLEATEKLLGRLWAAVTKKKS